MMVNASRGIKGTSFSAAVACGFGRISACERTQLGGVAAVEAEHRIPSESVAVKRKPEGGHVERVSRPAGGRSPACARRDEIGPQTGRDAACSGHLRAAGGIPALPFQSVADTLGTTVRGSGSSPVGAAVPHSPKGDPAAAPNLFLRLSSSLPVDRPRVASSSLRRAADLFQVSEPDGSIVPPSGLTSGGRTAERTRHEVAKMPRPWATRQGTAKERSNEHRGLVSNSLASPILSGRSSAVEHLPSKQTVASSNLVARSSCARPS